MKRFGLESSRVSSAVVALLVLFWVASIAPLGCTDNHSSNSGNTSQDGTFGDGGGDGLADDLALTDESAPDPHSTTGSEDAPSDLEAPDQEADLSPSPDLAPPDLSVGVDTAVAPDSSSGLGPLGKACVELLQNFCTGVLAKCDQLP
ncbi:MAG: hypothetical protein KC609_11985, partial [Myxococcales bacterium]|nr:hypothetical protein [Myxococcales bacterium]